MSLHRLLRVAADCQPSAQPASCGPAVTTSFPTSRPATVASAIAAAQPAPSATTVATAEVLVGLAVMTHFKYSLHFAVDMSTDQENKHVCIENGQIGNLPLSFALTAS